jgi:hypothetical protein
MSQKTPADVKAVMEFARPLFPEYRQEGQNSEYFTGEV